MKTKIKTKKLAALFLTLVLALGLLPMSTFVDAAISNDSTASITVENAVKGDKLAAYKVIDIEYNAGKNTLNYKWNDNFAEYFAGKEYTVEEFRKLESDSDALKTLLSGLPAYIKSKSIAYVDNQTVTETSTETGTKKYTATFSGLEMGEYFIRPTLSTSVYQLMLQKIEPTVSDGDGTYKIDDVTFDAKHNEVAITKTANKTSVTKGEKVNYTITVDIPTYDTGAADKYFSVTDTLYSGGFTIDQDSIKAVIQYGEKQEETLDIRERSYWDFSIFEDNSGFEFDVQPIVDATKPEEPTIIGYQYDNLWKNYPGDKLVITYNATFDTDKSLAFNENMEDNEYTNEAVFSYSNYPYVNVDPSDGYSWKSASVDVNTFAIKIDKYDKETSTKLAGATFDLYRTATTDEIKEGLAKDIPNITPTVKGIKLDSDFVTNAEGTVTFEKYEANGTKYDYYLVETKAPSGYNLLEEPQKVNFTDSDVAGTNGIYTVEVPNSQGIVLPTTGGAGTVIFTVIGISLMIGAVVLFVVSKKKVETE